MIKHIIPENKAVITREARCEISKEEYERVCKILDIENYEEWDDKKKEEYGIIEDDAEWILKADFDDGARLDWNLCFGSHNAYDDVRFMYPSGEWIILDCSYELDDIEIIDGNNIYIVRLDINE